MFAGLSHDTVRDSRQSRVVVLVLLVLSLFHIVWGDDRLPESSGLAPSTTFFDCFGFWGLFLHNTRLTVCQGSDVP